MPQDLNRVTLTGRLTRDPELHSTQGGTAVCSIRLASTKRRKNGSEWEEAPNYFDVSVWGAQGENCHRYLSKGRQIAVDGRLDWREFTRQDGSKGQAVSVIADSVVFLGGGENGAVRQRAADSDIPADSSGLPAAKTTAAADDDIPF